MDTESFHLYKSNEDGENEQNSQIADGDSECFEVTESQVEYPVWITPPSSPLKSQLDLLYDKIFLYLMVFM